MGGHGDGAQAAQGHDRPAPLGPLSDWGPWLTGAGLPFILVAYLGLRGGGYDEVVRGEVGIAAWWIVLAGAAVGVLPMGRISRGGFLAIGLLALFAVWTGLGIGWTESVERTVAELGRVATLLGIFALAVSVQRPDGLRKVVGGVGAGIALVAGVALLSRLQPSWFPALETTPGIDASSTRLHYPLDYWNGLGAFIAIGIPLLLAGASGGRTMAVRALSSAAIPALALAGFFTVSRGAALEAAVALVVLFALHPHRRALLLPLLVTAGGSAILMGLATRRDELTDGVRDGVAAQQGDEMLALAIVVCTAVALLSVALTYAEHNGLGPRPRLSRRSALMATAAAIMGIAVAALATGVPGDLAESWEEFEDPSSPTSGTARFDSASGSGRYQFWETALDAAGTELIFGIGPGTYEFFWAREGSLPTFVRDAHSLYLETTAELGIVGLVLILAFVGAPFALGVRLARGASREERAWLAAALGSSAAFATAAAIDWAWELTVLPVAFLLLSAGVLGLPGRPGPAGALPRLALGGLSLAGSGASAIPMAGTAAVRDSKAEVRAGDLDAALDQADVAASIQPYASTASLQKALVLELLDDLEGAEAAALEATENEPTNWRTWLVLSRVQAKLGDAEGSVASYRRARFLNPRSVLFQ